MSNQTVAIILLVMVGILVVDIILMYTQQWWWKPIDRWMWHRFEKRTGFPRPTPHNGCPGS